MKNIKTLLLEEIYSRDNSLDEQINQALANMKEGTELIDIKFVGKHNAFAALIIYKCAPES